MAFIKPPMLTGSNTKDIANLRDYLFRIAGSLDAVAEAPVAAGNTTVTLNGKKVTQNNGATEDAAEIIRKAAAELKSLIVKTANDVEKEAGSRLAGDQETLVSANSYTDGMTAVYDEKYVASSEYGAFAEEIHREIQDNAAGTAENYRMITEMSSDVSALQGYYRELNGEILRGIVYDPSIQDYVVGIAISQTLNVKATMSPGAQAAVPDDHVYYELADDQTFGLYTSTGWQFWIKGAKVGWFNSTDSDGALHVSSAVVESRVVNGGYWEQKTELINDGYMYVINYIGS